MSTNWILNDTNRQAVSCYDENIVYCDGLLGLSIQDLLHSDLFVSLLSDSRQFKVQMPIINVSPQMFSANPLTRHCNEKLCYILCGHIAYSSLLWPWFCYFLSLHWNAFTMNIVFICILLQVTFVYLHVAFLSFGLVWSIEAGSFNTNVSWGHNR